ncbi:thyroid hormone receptor beta [Elysia marginata]|uniref:Thyroid hormone receptor beta n=1 Tax=Elysia marginata TaxID=1093978 RepID=A0AAV4I0F3_9GAST|nr:thyroid hormone receptor beta [Elysia marginata]
MHSFRPPIIGDRWLLALQTTTPSKEVNQCVVCGESSDQVALHYSRMLCNGCRAFFKRAIQGKVNPGGCKAEGNCIVDANSRKSCKACRFEACVRAGVDASKVQNPKDLFLEETTESGSGSTTGNRTPVLGHALNPLNQDEVTPGSEGASTSQAEMPPKPRKRQGKPQPQVFLYSSEPPPMETNSLHNPQGNERLSTPVPNPPNLHGNGILQFANIPGSGITLVSYPESQNGYVPNPAGILNYLGGTPGHSHTPATINDLAHRSGPVGFGDIIIHPSLLPAPSDQRPGPSGGPVDGGRAILNPGMLTFHPGLDRAGHLIAVSNPYQFVNNTDEFNNSAPVPRALYSSTPGNSAQVAHMEGKLPTTQVVVTYPCGIPNAHSAIYSQPLTSADADAVYHRVKQEVKPSESTQDVSAITSGISSASLTNNEIHSRGLQRSEESQRPNQNFLGGSEEDNFSRPSWKTVDEYALHCRVQAEQRAASDAWVNGRPGATEVHNLRNTPIKQESSHIGIKKPSSFMIDDILGPDAPNRSAPLKQSSESVAAPGENTYENSTSVITSTKFLGEEKAENMSLAPATVNDDVIIVSGHQGSSPAKHCPENANYSSEELNVVDFTSSEESQLFQVAPSSDIEAKRDNPQPPDAKDSRTQSTNAALSHNSEAPVAVNAATNPSTPLQHSNSQPDENDSMEASMQNIASELLKLLSPATRNKLHNTVAAHKGEPIVDESQREVKQELFPLSDNTSRGDLDEHETNDSESGSVGWNSNESTPSKQSTDLVRGGSARKDKATKPISRNAEHNGSSSKSAMKKMLTPQKCKPLDSASPRNSPSRKKSNIKSENLVSQAQLTFKDGPSNRKCLEEIPENAQAEFSALSTSPECDNLKEDAAACNPVRRRVRRLAFSSSSEDDKPRPRPRRPAAKRPRPKYTSTPLVPPSSDSRAQTKSYNFRDFLHICGEFFQRELASANSSTSLGSSSSTVQPNQPLENSPDPTSSPKPDSSLLREAQASAVSLTSSSSANLAPEATTSQTPHTTASTSSRESTPAAETETSNRTGSGESRSDSGIASLLEHSGHENSISFLESIRSKVNTDPNYTMVQFKQEVLEFYRLSRTSNKTPIEDVTSTTPGQSKR